MMQYNALVPELYVADIRASLEFYLEVLGFTQQYDRTGPRFAFLSFRGSQLMLRRPQEQRPCPAARRHGVLAQHNTRDAIGNARAPDAGPGWLLPAVRSGAG